MTRKEIKQKTTENILERIKDHKIFKQISNNKEHSFYMVPENEEERREYKNFALLLVLYLRSTGHPCTFTGCVQVSITEDDHDLLICAQNDPFAMMSVIHVRRLGPVQ